MKARREGGGDWGGKGEPATTDKTNDSINRMREAQPTFVLLQRQRNLVIVVEHLRLVLTCRRLSQTEDHTLHAVLNCGTMVTMVTEHLGNIRCGLAL